MGAGDRDNAVAVRGVEAPARPAAQCRGRTSAAASWLARTEAHGDEDRLLRASTHEEARRHRGADPARFDAAWMDQRQETPPGWLTFDTTMLNVALSWIGTQTYAAERDYLAAHPELLDVAADDAVEEVLAGLTEQLAAMYQEIRSSARANGVHKAYAGVPGRLGGRVRQGKPGEPQSMLQARREELLSEFFGAVVLKLRSSEDQALALAANRAAYLLDLARSGEDEAFGQALASNSLDEYLHSMAMRPDPSSLLPAALLTLVADRTAASHEAALYYCAVATMIAGRKEAASDALARGFGLAPSHSARWLRELEELGRQHSAVLALIPPLTRLASA